MGKRATIVLRGAKAGYTFITNEPDFAWDGQIFEGVCYSPSRKKPVSILVRKEAILSLVIEENEYKNADN